MQQPRGGHEISALPSRELALLSVRMGGLARALDAFDADAAALLGSSGAGGAGLGAGTGTGAGAGLPPPTLPLPPLTPATPAATLAALRWSAGARALTWLAGVAQGQGRLGRQPLGQALQKRQAWLERVAELREWADLALLTRELRAARERLDAP